VNVSSEFLDAIWICRRKETHDIMIDRLGLV
jgi:hypothetical protein